VIVFDRPFGTEAPFPRLSIADGNISKEDDRKMIMDEIGDKIDDVDLVLNKILHQIWVIRSMAAVVMQWTCIWSLPVWVLASFFFPEGERPILTGVIGCVLSFLLIILSEGLFTRRNVCTLVFWCIAFPAIMIIQTIHLQLSHTRTIVVLALIIVLMFICHCLLIVLRKQCPGFWAVCVTEVGAITGYLFLSIIVIVAPLLIEPSTWKHSSEDVIMALGANILGDILVWVIILTAAWFGYFRYRKLSHVVSLRSKHRCCWKILWTCSTFGVELLINPRFVLGMKKVR